MLVTQDGELVLTRGRLLEYVTRTGNLETYLTGGIYDITLEVCSLVRHFLREGVLDSWVVGVDEVLLDELVHKR